MSEKLELTSILRKSVMEDFSRLMVYSSLVKENDLLKNHEFYKSSKFDQQKAISRLDFFNSNLSLLTLMENNNRNIEFFARKQHSLVLHHFHHSS